MRAYVVWVPRNGARAKHVERVTGLVTDPRATQYWDEHGAVIDPFDEMLSLTGPCAGIFAIYDPDATWDGSVPPTPDYYEDAHAREYNRPGPQFNVGRFADSVLAALQH